MTPRPSLFRRGRVWTSYEMHAPPAIYRAYQEIARRMFPYELLIGVQIATRPRGHAGSQVSPTRTYVGTNSTLDHLANTIIARIPEEP